MDTGASIYASVLVPTGSPSTHRDGGHFDASSEPRWTRLSCSPNISVMTVTLDHVGIPAADPEASSLFLGHILGEGNTTADGPDGDMFNLSVGQRALAWFEAPVRDPHHISFRVTESTFLGAIGRLQERGVPFGNDPGDTSNGETTDPLGGIGQSIFSTPTVTSSSWLYPADRTYPRTPGRGYASRYQGAGQRLYRVDRSALVWSDRMAPSNGPRARGWDPK